MKSQLNMLAAALTIAACTTPPVSETNEGTGGSGGSGSGGGGGEAPLGCALDVQWSPAETNPVGRDHHGTFAFTAGDEHYVYVTGGTDYTTIHDDVWRARVDEAGVMTPWESLAGLPSPRAGHGVATRDERVFLVAGRTSSAFLTSVVAADVMSDGTLSAWSELTSLPEGRFHLAAVESHDHLYVTGGLARDTQAATDTVFVAPILEDGALGEWTTSTLPSPRSHHASFVFGDHLYVAGGLEGQPAGFNTVLGDVLRARIEDDGSLGAWEHAGDLPAPRATHAALVRGSCVYFVGGLENITRKADCVATPIDELGMLGAGTPLASLMPDARSHTHHVVTAGDHALVLGGSIDLQTVTGATAVGRFVMP